MKPDRCSWTLYKVYSYLFILVNHLHFLCKSISKYKLDLLLHYFKIFNLWEPKQKASVLFTLFNCIIALYWFLCLFDSVLKSCISGTSMLFKLFSWFISLSNLIHHLQTLVNNTPRRSRVGCCIDTVLDILQNNTYPFEISV